MVYVLSIMSRLFATKVKDGVFVAFQIRELQKDATLNNALHQKKEERGIASKMYAKLSRKKNS